MSIESVVGAALRALVGGKACPTVNNVGFAAPYIVYTRVGGQATVFMERARPSKENARMQIACWADDELEAVQIAQQAELALIELTTVDAKPMGGIVSSYDPTTKLHGAIQDYSVWADR